jgi:hypothetical protein
MQLYGKYNVGMDGEDAVTVAEHTMVKALLRAGNDVVVDAMHVNPRYLKYWAKVSSELCAEFVVYDVRTPVDDCIDRDRSLKRFTAGQSTGATVIRKLAQRFPIEKWPTITSPPKIEVEPYVPDEALPEAIIVDIDGTLAHMTGRSPYDYSLVGEDIIDEPIRDLVNDWLFCGDEELPRHVLVVSGRDHSCRSQTLAWLNKHYVGWWALYMRPENAKDHNGNKLPDWIVKLDIFNREIRHHYNVRFVLDDRNQVVEMWRKLGLKCLQVQPGDF